MTEPIEGEVVDETAMAVRQRLAAPFPPQDVEWRIQRSGKSRSGKIWAMVLCYITARAIMDRLDEAVGIENWRDEYAPGPEPGSMICRLSLRIGDEWITKEDGAPATQVEATKGAISDALKRAGVKWGIGRYLYKLEAGFAKIHDNGQHRARLKDKTEFRWDPPRLPEWAIPGKVDPPPPGWQDQGQPPADDGPAPEQKPPPKATEAKLQKSLNHLKRHLSKPQTQRKGAAYLARVIHKANKPGTLLLGDDECKPLRHRLYQQLGRAGWGKDDLADACAAWFNTDWATIPKPVTPYLEIFFSMVPATALQTGLPEQLDSTKKE